GMTAETIAHAPELTSTRDAILDAAERRFAERGFEGVSVREIAADVGLKNQASLYYHFASKQEIYEAAFNRGVESIIALLAGADGTRAPSVAADLDRVVDYLVDHPHLARLIQRAGLDDSAFVRSTVRRLVEPLYTQGLRALRQAGGPWHTSELPHLAAGLYHLIFGYFADAALLEAVFGEDLHSAAALARQRRFLKTAVARLIGGAPDGRAPEDGNGGT
ncbi:MAG: TetR family transcriptional regulator, partial [Chloroflexota bacterium]